MQFGVRLVGTKHPIDIIDVPVSVVVNDSCLVIRNTAPIVYEHKGRATRCAFDYVEFGLVSDDGAFIPFSVDWFGINSIEREVQNGQKLTLESVKLTTPRMTCIEPEAPAKVGKLSLGKRIFGS